MAETNRTNLSKMWDTLNSIINKKKRNKLVTFHHNLTIFNGRRVNCKTIQLPLSECITTYIYKSIPTPSKDPCSFVNNISNTLYFNPVSEDEIISIISKFKNKSAGYDEIEAKVMKYVKESFIQQ